MNPAEESLLVVEVEEILRSLVCRALSEAGFTGPIYQADDGINALQLAEIHAPSLILLDVNLPGLNGFDFADALIASAKSKDRTSRAKWPKILLLTSRLDEATLLRAAAAPLAGFVWKLDCSLMVLREAVSAVLAGGIFFSPRVRLAMEANRRSPDSITKILSSKEIALLIDLGRGDSNEEISSYTGLTAACVRTRRQRIMKKLNLPSTVALMQWTRAQGFFDYCPSDRKARAEAFAKSQEPREKSQERRAKSQEPRAKSQERGPLQNLASKQAEK